MGNVSFIDGHIDEPSRVDLLKDAYDLINRQQAEIENYKQIAENQQSVSMDKEVEIKRLRAENERLLQKLQQAQAEAVKEFAERANLIIEQIVDIMFDDNESKCRIDGCRYPSNIPCGNEICLKENKAFWKSKINNILKEMVGEDK